jgi:hypothetical protein
VDRLWKPCSQPRAEEQHPLMRLAASFTGKRWRGLAREKRVQRASMLVQTAA